jgi:hypothetical protein
MIENQLTKIIVIGLPYSEWYRLLQYWRYFDFKYLSILNTVSEILKATGNYSLT